MAKMHFKTCYKTRWSIFKDINDRDIQLIVRIERKNGQRARKSYQKGVLKDTPVVCGYYQILNQFLT